MMNTRIQHISPVELKERIDRGDSIVLLDVREPFELEISKLDNIIHIPMMEIPHRLDELNRSDEIVCICHMGGRSHQVAAFLVDQGFAKVYNLLGGMNGYAQTVDSTLPVY